MDNSASNNSIGNNNLQSPKNLAKEKGWQYLFDAFDAVNKGKCLSEKEVVAEIKTYRRQGS